MRTFERAWSGLVGALDGIADWRPVRFAQVGGYSLLAGFASGPFVAPDVAALVGIGAAAASAAVYTVADRQREQRSPAFRAAVAAAAARAKLQAIEDQYATENAALRAASERARADQQAALWEWERAALAADGGALEPPTGQRVVGRGRATAARHPLLWELDIGGWRHTSLGAQLHAALRSLQGGRFASIDQFDRVQSLVAWLRGQQADGTLPKVSDADLLAMLEPDSLQGFSQGGPTGYGGAPPPPARPTCWCMPYGWDSKLEVTHEHYWPAHEGPRP